MKRLALAATALVALAASAGAQVIPPGTNPVPAGGAYNAVAPTCVTGSACWLQVDVNGKLLVSSTFSPSGTQDVNIKQWNATSLGVPTAYGTAPTTGNYIGVNSFVTNFPATQPISGSVAVTSDIPGTGATNLGKAEDTVHTSGDTGVFGLALANEAQTVLAQDGDYIGHGADTKGNTFITGPVASGATDSGNPIKIGGRYNSAVQAFTNGQRADLQVDQRGGLLIQDGQAIPSVSVTSATTLFTVADTSGYGSISVQVTSAGSASTITYEGSEDGTTWFVVVGYLTSNAGASNPFSTTTTATQAVFPLSAKQFRARVSTYGSGTVTIQGTLRKDQIPRTAVVVGNTVNVSGTVNDAAAVGATGLPTLYEGRTTNKTAVTTGQYVRPIATSIGAAVNKPFQVPELDWSYPAAAGGISNTTTAVTMVAAAGAGIRNYLTAIQVSAGALGAASEIAVRDGAGGTVIWRGFISTAGGNQSVNLSSPIKSTANTLLEVVTLTATITGAVYINAQGYQAP